MKQLYLIPVSFNSNGKIAIEYRLMYVKHDMRTKFCRIHEKHLVYDLELLMKTAHKNGAHFVGDRLIMPNGKSAYEFQKVVKSHTEAL